MEPAMNKPRSTTAPRPGRPRARGDRHPRKGSHDRGGRPPERPPQNGNLLDALNVLALTPGKLRPGAHHLDYYRQTQWIGNASRIQERYVEQSEGCWQSFTFVTRITLELP